MLSTSEKENRLRLLRYTFNLLLHVCAEFVCLDTASSHLCRQGV